MVAILTHKRPKQLERCLLELAKATIPDAVSLAVTVVDNDKKRSGETVACSDHPQLTDLRYIVEERKGIPIARNRAVVEALADHCDALCFIDDDEYPSPSWLTGLVHCWQANGAHLVGGPVLLAEAPQDTTRWQRFVHASVAARAKRRASRNARRAAAGHRVTVLTNNWLCDLDWLERNGLRFDEEMRHSGGSDTAFFRAAEAAGCNAKWSPDSVVREMVVSSRLSFRYHFRRAAYQSMTHFHMKYPERSKPLYLTTLLKAMVRALLGLLLLVVPVFGIASPIVAIRSLGWSFGRIGALSGERSRLYE